MMTFNDITDTFHFQNKLQNNMNTLKEAEAKQIVGRKLKKEEKVLVQIFGDDAEYQWYKDEKGNLAASKTGRENTVPERLHL